MMAGAVRLTERKLLACSDDLMRVAGIVSRHVRMLEAVTANPKSRHAQACRELARHREGLRECRRAIDAIEQGLQGDSLPTLTRSAALRDDLAALADQLTTHATAIGELSRVV